MPPTTLLIPSSLDGARLDTALSTLLPDMSRSAIRRIIDTGAVALPYGKARAARAVRTGERIEIEIPEAQPLALAPSTGELSVIYQDDDLIIIDKPAGLTVHPGAGHTDDTLVHRLLGYDPRIIDAGDVTRPGIVHRLDRDTSGLIAIARTPAAHTNLARQWHDRTVKKGYTALVEGLLKSPEGIVEMPIGRDPRHRQRMAPIAGGRPATTRYHVREEVGKFSLLDVEIATGRTHQIRVHMAALGHPVAGDRLYGARQSLPNLSRQFLHASTLGLHLPSTDEYHAFTAPLPADLNDVLEELRAGQ